MFSSRIICMLFLVAVGQASVLSTTNIETVLEGATSQSSLTIPADARAAIAKLGTGGANVTSLSTADKTAISTCTTNAQNNNTASKANLGGGTGTQGNIDFVANKISIHACESAGQQISLATGGAGGSDTDINLLISNVGVLNANTNAAGITGKRELGFLESWHEYRALKKARGHI